MCRMAVCIPTYNRVNEIKYLLENELIFFKDLNFDLYIFDSSTNSETNDLVCGYKSCNNLFYYKIDSSVHPNMKVFIIYETIADFKMYDYLWMVHDHTFWGSEALKIISQQLLSNADLICLDVLGNQYNVKKNNSLNDLLLSNSWILTRFGASILKTSSYLNNVDWVYYKKKYSNEKLISFSHVGFIFEQACNINDFSAISVSIPMEYSTNLLSHLGIGGISWYNDSFNIVAQKWAACIDQLPEIYTNKDEVLRSVDRFYFSTDKILIQKKEGKYTLKDFWKYKKLLKKMVPDLYYKLLYLALIPYNCAEHYYINTLNNIVKKAQNKKVAIYGAGNYGTVFGSQLIKYNIPFDVFLVSKSEGNPSSLLDHDVCVFEEYVKKNNVFIIIALANRNVDSVKKHIKDISKKTNYIYIGDI